MTDLTFVHYKYSFYVLVPIAVLVLLILGYRKKSIIAAYFNKGYLLSSRILGIGLLTLGFLLVVLALMGPSKPLGTTEVKSSGLDLYVLIDTSKSMLSEDVPPSRLDRGKAIVQSILEELDGDRIGFVPFASSSYVQMPLTDDYDLADMFLEVVDTDMISGGGSNVARGLEVAMASFDESATGDQVILIISDGEEHNDETKAVLDELKNSDIKVFTVGIGTLEGGLIPELGPDGKQVLGYKKDASGNTILTKLNETLLVSLASETKGIYYREATTTNVAQVVLQDLAFLEESVRGVKKIENYDHLFQYFLGAGLMLLIIGWAVMERGGIHEKMADSIGN